MKGRLRVKVTVPKGSPGAKVTVPIAAGTPTH
ncbi:MAG: hypothetical protein QOI38_265 [Sphingomonadales bacterium]|jgi:hypothetical protein|nr:hypothetical protein [Sphingomonadales bacterium]